MKVLVTGSLGLVGSAAVRYYLDDGCKVIGIDNDMRRHFFGEEASVVKNKIEHENYTFHGIDISKIETIIETEKPDAIIHAAAQPSHDYSAKNPLLDFGVNAYSTLMLLEMVRKHCPAAVFVYTSTNKVYGDWPNYIEFKELDYRYEPVESSLYKDGVNEETPIDNCIHSPFGVSKLAGDLYCQEYARYFGIKTCIFRCGCITGAAHAGTELHGFLSYMVKCKKLNRPYKVFGYKGKQVRDQIHADDLISAIDCFIRDPKPGNVYNMGGADCNISVLEALNLLNIKNWEYFPEARVGDHQWYITDLKKFKHDYPHWEKQYPMWAIIDDLMRGSISS